ncbi:MAG: NUDIX domain-containing protein [Planctomycetia bacterium]|nr:NUDIX domain-containing protein [Planctomycetia bacterium]
MPKIKVKQIDSYIYRNTDAGPVYLMLKRSTGKHYEHLWQGVAGKIEKGETATQTVIRELKEETGKKPKRLFVADHIASFYDARNDRIQMVPIFGIEVENSEVQLSEEHSDYKWVSFDEALNLLTWKGQKEGLRTVHDEIVSGDDRTKWSEIKLQ